MAGWDHTFTIDPKDIVCFRSCMRVWRKTCARHWVEMEYRKWRMLPSGRVEYLISYNLQSVNIGPAVGEFLIEMRAVSTTMGTRRERDLPLRLARNVASINSWTVREQESDGETSDPFKALEPRSQERVLAVLEDFQAGFWSWRCSLISPADFVEAQHSLVLELGLVFGSAHSRSKFPKVVDGLALLPVQCRRQLKKLGEKRNRIKHKEFRHEAPSVAEAYLHEVHTATHLLTGIDVDPVSSDVQKLLDQRHGIDPLRPPMFYRSGEARSVRR